MNLKSPEYLASLVEENGPSDAAVIELPVLLTGRLADFLEQEAHRRGQTAGQLIRRILSEFFQRQPRPGNRPARNASAFAAFENRE
jgi:hypothetical protein